MTDWIKTKLKYAFFVLVGAAAALLAVYCLFGGRHGLAAGYKLARVVSVADRQFVTDYNSDSALNLACTAYVLGLGDKWSYYMTAEGYNKHVSRVANEYRGIGVTVEADGQGRGLAVTGVTEDSPAALAGILPGEVITAAGGTPLAGMELSEATDAINALFDGGEFTLDVLDAAGRGRVVTLGAENIYAAPVSFELLDGDVGYIRIENFETGSAEESIAAVESLTGQGAQYLLFDVRGNPGGLVSQLTELLDFLLPEGDIFISTNRAGDTNTQVSDAECVELPMAVLVDGESYSAAEYFAAALREYGVAVVVGGHTTGKARSQINCVLYDGSAIHISKYAYITPKGVDLSETGGIAPDVEAELTEEESEQLYAGLLETDADSGVASAVSALKNP